MNKLFIKHKVFFYFFSLQFLGAFNDNVFKNALVILITFHAITILGMQSQILVTFAFGIFILPFFLFSALAGQLADKYPKSSLIRVIKFGEIVIMLFATIGLYFQHYPFLLLVLFLMGMQSTFFGPIKYSILPTLTELALNEQPGNISKKQLLVQANGLIEMGTFAAILLGTIVGGLLSGSSFTVNTILPVSLVVIALIGWFLSLYLPEFNAADSELKIHWNLYKESKQIISYTKENLSIYRVIILISWFWFLGASILSQIPNWTKTIIDGNESVVTILLTCFSLGIGIGSLLCSRLNQYVSYRKISQYASVGISLSLLLFVFSSYLQVDLSHKNLLAYYGQSSLIFVYLVILSLGFFGGLFIVPLYYFIQEYSDPSILSRIIAANNIYNALFMVTSSVIISILLLAKISLPLIMLLCAIANILVVSVILNKDKNDLSKQAHFYNLS